MGKELSEEEAAAIERLLKAHKDNFAWTTEDMSGLALEVALH